MPATAFSKQYLNTPPPVQVDIMATLEEEQKTTYMNRKVNKLLACGVSKVIRIVTAAESVLVATPAGSWQWMNWDTDLQLLPGLPINIGHFITSVHEQQQ